MTWLTLIWPLATVLIVACFSYSAYWQGRLDEQTAQRSCQEVKEKK